MTSIAMVEIMVVNCALDKSKVLLSKQKLVKVEDTDSDETLPPDCDSLHSEEATQAPSEIEDSQYLFVSEIN